jgi:PAS domain-containing protein
LIYTPEDEQAGVLQQEMGDALSKGRALDERWHLRKDGSRFWASGELLVLQEDAAFKGFIKILRDRTTERLAVEELETSQARLAFATEAASIGIWDWDLKTGAMAYSDKARAICGFRGRTSDRTSRRSAHNICDFQARP